MWSKYQENVFKFVETGSGNGAVEAVAGSGKTTTAMEMVKRFSPIEQGLFTSFTNTIVTELDKRITSLGLSNVRSKTYNSFGAGLIFKYMKPAPMLLKDYNGQKTDKILKHDVLYGLQSPADNDSYFKCKNAIIRTVSLFKNLAILTVADADARLDQILEYYDIEIPQDKRFRELLLATYGRCLARTDIIDFDDQKLFPLLFDWPVPQVDFLIIDEFQDTCPLESKLMLRACKRGRIIVFGDRNQAIYSFKGTTPDSMQEFILNQHATGLPLSICYRCPQAVIREAQKIVPHIEWAPNAIEGSVRTIAKSLFDRTVGEKDLVLARVTQDLVASVMNLLSEGRAAYVEGREYGTQLKWFIEKLLNNTEVSRDRLIAIVDEEFNTRHPELIRLNKEHQALVLETKVECVKILSVGCASSQDVIKKIDTIFTDRGNGIRHMTIHKSKGLEGHKDGDVHILRPDKLPHPRAKTAHHKAEEKRLQYVAITRSRRGLNYVTRAPGEK